MFRLDVLQNRWLILAMAGGIAVLLAVILFFLALGRPRRDEGLGGEGGPVEKLPFFAWIGSFMPWLIILALAATAAFIVAYTVAAMRHAPNW